jgi:hypothetical protein
MNNHRLSLAWVKYKVVFEAQHISFSTESISLNQSRRVSSQSTTNAH